MSTDKIQFDLKKLRRLKKLYKMTVGDEFTFDGHILLKSYAKYLIMYLEKELKKGK